jgi:hypothetical protein
MSVTVLPLAAAGEAARADLVVSVGGRATEQALRLEPATPVLAVLLPQASFLRLRAKAEARALSAIFLDQPPGRRFALIAEAFPEVRRVGVVLGSRVGGGGEKPAGRGPGAGHDPGDRAHR